MKTYLVLLSLLFSVSSVAADALDVKMETIYNEQTRPRSITPAPIVTIDDETFQLSIKFAAPNESFTLFVYDEKGNVIYQDNVLTDGGNHNYMLPTLDYGNYSLVIESERVSYEGEFDI